MYVGSGGAVEGAAAASRHAAHGAQSTVTLDPDSPVMKEEILRMVAAYLANEGYTASSMLLMDEANVRRTEGRRAEQRSKSVKKAILDGDWAEVEKFCNKSSIKSMKNFLYCVYKQQYLELVDRQEYQKAFTYLTKKLKPFEKQRSHPEEFKDLCYLLTCKSIADVDKDWDGIAAARARLGAMFTSLVADSELSDAADNTQEVPPGRLLQLLEQAVAHQINSCRYRPKVLPPISTLLRDYECFVLPNALAHQYVGHAANVKCISFFGADGQYLVSGSSDQTVRVWQTGRPDAGYLLLKGHSARIWDIATSPTGSVIASASGDSTVKIWNVDGDLPLLSRETSNRVECEAASTLSGHKGDVYCLAYHAESPLVTSGGYDKTVKLWDTEKGMLVRSFNGHEASVTCATYTAQGNLIISGSKDSSVRFWDMVSGVMVNSLSCVGDVTSVDISSNGLFMLTASKGNSNRLWDLRKIVGGDSAKAVRLYKGHQNTATNFIRASFGPAASLVMSGSEDGYAYVWDRESGAQVQRLGGYHGIVYSAVWSSRQSTLATSSHDGIVRTWWYDETKPIEYQAEYRD